MARKHAVVRAVVAGRHGERDDDGRRGPISVVWLQVGEDPHL